MRCRDPSDNWRRNAPADSPALYHADGEMGTLDPGLYSGQTPARLAAASRVRVTLLQQTGNRATVQIWVIVISVCNVHSQVRAAQHLDVMIFLGMHGGYFNSFQSRTS